MRTCIPTKDNDTWIMASSQNLGLLKIHIDINDNYKVTVTDQFNTLILSDLPYISSTGKCLGLVGTNDEYMVYTDVFQGRYVIKSFDNPFLS